MDTTAPTCPACQTDWRDGQTCEDHFHQMLFWEAEDPANGVVHHLMVLCYHLQHPHLYSPDGLRYSKGLLVDFVARNISPQEVRQRSRDQVASGNRAWKITARPDSVGAYEHPVAWTMTAQDVVAAGIENYIERVRTWAQSVYSALKVSHNLEQ